MFLNRYGERNGYPCPSHNPVEGKQGITDEEIVLLPSKTEKMDVYEVFVASRMSQPGECDDGATDFEEFAG